MKCRVIRLTLFYSKKIAFRYWYNKMLFMVVFLGNIQLCYSFLNIKCRNQITLIIFSLFPSLHFLCCSDGGFSFMNVQLQPLVFPLSLPALSNDPHAGQGWTEEQWCLLACQRNVTASSVQGQLESVACSSQSLQGLAETHTHTEGCLPSLSFISFTLFHVLNF